MTYLYRELEQTIIKYTNRREIIAIVGPRQCGKTTLISHIISKLENTHKITFDDIEMLEMFEHDLKTFIEIHIKPYRYVFIDEIQYSENSGKHLKFIFDTCKTKIFISGSSATDLSIKSLKFLVGRVFIFNLYPLSFSEYLRYKDPKFFNTFNEMHFSEVVLNRLNISLKEYLMYGGYPEVVIAEKLEEKQEILKNIYNTYFLREIKQILNLTEDYKLSKLIKALSLQIGSTINYNELCSLTEFSYSDLKKYLNILEKTFICKEARNFHTNRRQELKKSPKIFFVDPGFRNISIRNFSHERSDLGSLHENFIFLELIKKDYEVKYWRTKAKAEVDFVIEKEGKIYPIEVKSIIIDLKIGKSFLSFVGAYRPEKGFILSLGKVGKRKVGKTEILFNPIISISNIDKLLAK